MSTNSPNSPHERHEKILAKRSQIDRLQCKDRKVKNTICREDAQNALQKEPASFDPPSLEATARLARINGIYGMSLKRIPGRELRE
jgi:hypothetical protein